jgi:hypothetical protein
MIVISPFRILVAIARIERRTIGQVHRSNAVRLERAVDRIPIERQADNWRMTSPVIHKWRFHACGVLVIVVDACLLWVSAAGIEPDLVIPFDRIPPSHLEWIKEDHPIKAHANRPHR